MPVKKPRRFEFKEGESDKLWEISTAGKQLTTRWGKSGTDGQSTTKAFASGELAENETDKLIRKKLEEGYAETGPRPKPRPNRTIDPKTMASVRTSWKRIDRWLARNAPPVHGMMGKPATAEDIDRAERAMGLELPDDVRASYSIHNGSISLGFFPSGDYLSLKDMVDQYKFLKGMFKSNPDGPEAHPTGPIRKEWYNPGWVPLTHNGGGDHAFIDLAPAKGGKVGQLIDYGHEEGAEGVAAPSLSAYLRMMADALESGAAVFFNTAYETSGMTIVEQYLEWPDGKPSRSGFPPAPKAGRKLQSGAEGNGMPKGRYFEMISDASAKFWEVFRNDSLVIMHWGRIGTKGKTDLKRHASSEDASAEMNKVVAKKIAEGYVERP